MIDFFLAELLDTCAKRCYTWNMRIEKFVERFHLNLAKDDCKDTVIRGKVGDLYFEDGFLCLIVIDGPLISKSKWAALGGKQWLGDISRVGKANKGIQDVQIKRIPEANWKLAIKLAKARTRKVLSPEEKARMVERLARARAFKKGTEKRNPTAQNRSEGEGRTPGTPK